MAKLLYIKASPMGDRSYSTRVAEAFIEAYKKSHPGDVVEILDLWSEKLPDFDFTAAEGKYKVMRGKPHSDEEAKAWSHVVKCAEYFKSADKFLLSSPMWNFGIPYRLKQYLDIILQPGLTFSYSPQTGYTGLVTGKPLQLILARGGAYSEGTGGEKFDHQLPYLKLAFGYIGFTDIKDLAVEPTLMGGPEVADEKFKASIEAAKKIAESF